ncbi:probable component of translocase of the outer mitochondrial membrane complex [Phialocephala subalpina]|uniref:Probable component of translocase of the outer mitochondrial membrane complex n=1 Tax=Phialocephala subalpina TaxID=576137 RepID=A0A1L7WKK4_9HELO|nr:probable component of translocase of the outer mitochondrial membrane complex [Phialocephala subalpina]
MAPKQQRIQVAKADPRRPAQKGYIASTYQTLTSPENASVVRSIAVFGAAVAFFSSSWSEFLLPPL